MAKSKQNHRNRSGAVWALIFQTARQRREARSLRRLKKLAGLRFTLRERRERARRHRFVLKKNCPYRGFNKGGLCRHEHKVDA